MAASVIFQHRNDGRGIVPESPCSRLRLRGFAIAEQSLAVVERVFLGAVELRSVRLFNLLDSLSPFKA
ncbi:MAG: hypothetical protein DBY30_05830 [Verrucomicrobia bacterium]|nr:MAG: hypothetical protein DBY30_05830 [Verrucomicrobiota bacterium]